METEITRNQAGRIIRMMRKGCTEFTFTILLQSKQYRSHYHHRKLNIFAVNGSGITEPDWKSGLIFE